MISAAHNDELRPKPRQSATSCLRYTTVEARPDAQMVKSTPSELNKCQCDGCRVVSEKLLYICTFYIVYSVLARLKNNNYLGTLKEEIKVED